MTLFHLRTCNWLSWSLPGCLALLLALPEIVIAQGAPVVRSTPAARVRVAAAADRDPAGEAGDSTAAEHREALLKDELLRIEVELHAIERKKEALEEERKYLEKEIKEPSGSARNKKDGSGAADGDSQGGTEDLLNDAEAEAFGAPLLIGDRTDLTHLGIALIEARGAMRLAENELQQLASVAGSSPAATENSAMAAAKIRLQTARDKVELLNTIAEAAYDVARSELNVQERLAARTRLLSQKGFASAAGMEQVESVLVSLRSRTRVLEAMVGSRSRPAGSKATPAAKNR